MGLDSYLSKKIYIGAEHAHRNVSGKIEITIGGKPLDINFKSVSFIEERAAYWRKANHIHKWFVDNCQDGEDNCKEYYVSTEQLKELHDACKEVMKSKGKKNAKNIAQKLLPPQDGDFFGDTEIDKYYYDSIRDTQELLFKLLIVPQGQADFYYRSSW